VKRILALTAALVLGLSSVALGQAGSPEMEIVDINGSRYAEGGNTTIVIEFRNLSEPPDPSRLVVTVNGEPVADQETALVGETSVPVGVVLAIDASGSMRGAPLEAAKAAAKDFVSQKRTEDAIALITFADEVEVLSGFTTVAGDLESRIDAIVAEGETAFNDAVVKGVELYDDASAENLLANLIVLTDGDDTVSVATLEEAVAAVADHDVRVFGVALESPDFSPEPVEAISDAGNGLFLSTPDPEQLSSLYDQIVREISNTVVTRFVSPISTPGDVEFEISYPGVESTGQVFAVSGFATTTTAGAVVTTTTLPPAAPTSVIESGAAFDRSTLILIAAGGLGLTLFLFVVILFGREEDEGGSRFAKRLQAYGRRTRPLEDEKKPFLERLPILKRFSQAAEEEVRRRGMMSGVNAALEQANLPLTAGEAIMAMIGLSAVIGIFFSIFSGLLTGLITFVISILFFAAFINFAGSREKKRFEKQLPDTLTLLSTSLRAGYSLLQAIEAVAQEAPDPTAREFSRAVAETRLGRSVPDALQGIVDRTQSEDFEWAVMAIEIQREVGGNLAEVLQTVADTMLARNRLKGEIRALTAEGRLSAIVIGALPIFMGGFLWFTNRGYLQPLLDETVGVIAIGVGVLLMLGGFLWLKKIVDIEV
jgi:tight adherence protein B